MNTYSTQATSVRIYDGDGDALFLETGLADKLVLAPEGRPIGSADKQPRLRLMWGQYLLDDLLAGRYSSLVCAANAEDNTEGILGQLATMLPGSQWTPESVTAHARQFAQRDDVTVLKYDMGLVEVLALLRPSHREVMTMEDLSHGFELVSQLLRHHTQWRPTATVSFLEGRANRLEDAEGNEPSFESILQVMHEAGYDGDVYPSPAMFEAAPTAVFSRYPFPDSLEAMRSGGF
ncbi:hypothetical protein [Algisphaera agarilytica]|uniref:Uncharacterized protein n=1 Tax=Algisphaera agarilytica TaxID=1385975 RepID=A0A7X0LIY0_9BACT|nr:hypothetical protein [Algisphaera agarilytica]MBB6428204.1 hypothetical protein [Algisphaera agarilytica]